MNITRFKTLMLREWMQHRRGWLILMGVLPVLLLLLVLFGDIQTDSPLPPLMLAAFGMLGVTAAIVTITWLAVLLQSGSLARRDTQDRSIEFWLSLPAGHAESVGATVLMHVLAIPLLALTVGFVVSQVLVHILVWRVSGSAGWMGLPWATLVPISVGLYGRAVFGLVLATLWALPFVLVPMAAAAWLKRWGVPMTILLTTLGHGLLYKFYGIRVIGETLEGWLHGARDSFVSTVPPGWGGDHSFSIDLSGTPGWLLRDAWHSVTLLAQPLFVTSLAITVACFALLVLRRSRGG